MGKDIKQSSVDKTIENIKKENNLKNDKDYLALYKECGCNNYDPIPVVIESAKGVKVIDVNGKTYTDFLSAYSAINFGHCNERLVKTFCEQATKLTLTSRAFQNTQLCLFSKYITDYFKYDKVLPMNSGVEAGESAIKICRKWGYNIKKIPNNQAVILFAHGNFWGRTIAAVSSSDDKTCYEGFGPYTPGFKLIDYNDPSALENELKADKNIAGFYVEPIQGEAGVNVPDDGYLSKCRELCTKYNVLLICDEIQTGLGRTGKVLCVDHENVRPDILVLGKSLSGGLMPVSAVLCDKQIMDCIKPGEHGSTYGGNPLACILAIECLKLLKESNYCENSSNLGEIFRKEINELNLPFIKKVRGKGLFNAVIIDENHHINAKKVCLKMMENGILCKHTHDHIIRFAPPICITPEEFRSALDIIKSTFISCK